MNLYRFLPYDPDTADKAEASGQTILRLLARKSKTNANPKSWMVAVSPLPTLVAAIGPEGEEQDISSLVTLYLHQQRTELVRSIIAEQGTDAPMAPTSCDWPALHEYLTATAATAKLSKETIYLWFKDIAAPALATHFGNRWTSQRETAYQATFSKFAAPAFTLPEQTASPLLALLEATELADSAPTGRQIAARLTSIIKAASEDIAASLGLDSAED